MQEDHITHILYLNMVAHNPIDLFSDSLSVTFAFIHGTIALSSRGAVVGEVLRVPVAARAVVEFRLVRKALVVIIVVHTASSSLFSCGGLRLQRVNLALAFFQFEPKSS
jgi:hypothetical protein